MSSSQSPRPQAPLPWLDPDRRPGTDWEDRIPSSDTAGDGEIASTISNRGWGGPAPTTVGGKLAAGLAGAAVIGGATCGLVYLLVAQRRRRKAQHKIAIAARRRAASGYTAGATNVAAIDPGTASRLAEPGSSTVPVAEVAVGTMAVAGGVIVGADGGSGDSKTVSPIGCCASALPGEASAAEIKGDGKAATMGCDRHVKCDRCDASPCACVMDDDGVWRKDPAAKAEMYRSRAHKLRERSQATRCHARKSAATVGVAIPLSMYDSGRAPVARTWVGTAAAYGWPSLLVVAGVTLTWFAVEEGREMARLDRLAANNDRKADALEAQCPKPARRCSSADSATLPSEQRGVTADVRKA